MSDFRNAERIMWAHTMTRNNVSELVEEGMNIDDVLNMAKNDRDFLEMLKEHIEYCLDATYDGIEMAQNIRRGRTKVNVYGKKK